MEIRIALISALAPNRSIGHADSLPWRLPRDMRFFRRMTSGHVVVMGRKTFESLGCKPLPKRINVILTRSRTYEHTNVLVARNIDDAIDIAKAKSKKGRLFVIGGGSIYDQFGTMADELYLTQIQPRDPNQKYLFDEEFYGDTFFPKLRKSSWNLCHVSRLYRAMDTTSPKVEIDQVNHYFRFFKYGKRSSCGCTPAERLQVEKMLKHQIDINFPLGLNA